MKVHDIFSELSSETRLEVLDSLSKNPLKFTKISEKIGLSSPEASRQLHRLVDAKLVDKNVDGLYSLSIFGRLTLSCISDLRFVSKKSEYFSSHDPSPIPAHFLSRIDLLSSCELVTGVYEIISTLEGHLKNVEDYLYFMGDDFPRHYQPIVKARMAMGLKFRAIYPEVFIKGVVPTLEKKFVSGQEIRGLDSIGMTVTVSEVYAGIRLPGENGKIDHNTFLLGLEPEFIEWCSGVFNYYWEKAEPYIT